MWLFRRQIAARLLTGLWRWKTNTIFKTFICVKTVSLRVFVADQGASAPTQMPSSILLCGLNYAIGVGDLQNRMCSDIAVTSKVEILDTSFVASTPVRSEHW